MIRIDDQGVMEFEIFTGDPAEILDKAQVESLRTEGLFENAVTF